MLSRPALLGLSLLFTGGWSSVRGQADELDVRFIGNAGVSLSDGETTLLIDLPYVSGASGYMRYDPNTLRPIGNVVSVFTHEHRDHFDAAAVDRNGWPVVGGRDVVGSVNNRALTGARIEVGRFSIAVVETPHTPSHRSYRIHWRGRSLYFVGDTEDVTAVVSQPRVDLLFITPWLSCAVERADKEVQADRIFVYHQNPNGSDRICLGARELGQNQSLTFGATPNRGPN